MPRLVLLVAPLTAGCFAVLPSRGGGQIGRPPATRTTATDDVAVTAGYRLEVVAEGLALPTAVAFDDAGRPHVVEAGYSYGEVFLTPRLVRVDHGTTIEIARGDNGPWTGAVWHEGAFYVAEGGVERGGRIVRVDLDGTLTPIVDGMPSFGDHHTNGPALSPDGWLYFGQGTATNAGVVGQDNASFGWLARHPDFHDVSCVDVVLAGEDFTTVRAGGRGRDRTGAFVPFGTPTEPGQVVTGELLCSGAVYRVRPDGSDLERVAFGFRNPFGLAFSPDGELYVTDNGYDVRGSRPVFGSADWLWRVEPGSWYGWPDFSGGLPLGEHRWKAPGHTKPRPVLSTWPGEPPDPVARFGVHASADGLDFSRDPSFGHVGEAFVALFGDQASGTGKVQSPVGFGVVRVDVRTGVMEDFLTNEGRSRGPASFLGTQGLERPVAVRFDPTGASLYVVDFGVLAMDGGQALPVPGTGVLWRVTRSDARIAVEP